VADASQFIAADISTAEGCSAVAKRIDVFATALQQEVEEIGAEHSVFVLEEHASRPLTGMPEIILEDLARSQVSIFCAQTQPGELGSRIEIQPEPPARVAGVSRAVISQPSSRL
jgi:hypothetical protein